MDNRSLDRTARGLMQLAVEITSLQKQARALGDFGQVERPLLKQLVAMEWDFVQSDLEYPAKTFRTSFRETVFEPRLKAAIRRINKDDHGNEWLGFGRDAELDGVGR